MFIKLYYVLQNSCHNLIRTKGIFSTLILSLLIATISFFTFNVFLFFNHIHQQMVLSLESETDFISVQMGMAPVMGMLIFKIAVFILAITLILLTITYIKKSFKQFLITQKEEFQIMALLGETLSGLNLFYTFQVSIFSFVAILCGYLLGSKLFYLSVIETIKVAIGSDNVNNFQGNTSLSFFIVFTALLYIFITTFFASNKLLNTESFYN